MAILTRDRIINLPPRCFWPLLTAELPDLAFSRPKTNLAFFENCLASKFLIIY